MVLAALFRPERYDAQTGMDPAELVAGLRAEGVDASYIPEVDDIVTAVVSGAEIGDVVLIMSNGGFGGIHTKLLTGLEGR